MVDSVFTPRSDKLLNEKWDLVLSNGLVKAGLGLGVGIVGSVLLFKRRAWPAVFGTGFGAGIGWSEGDAIFQNAYTAEGKREFKA